MPALRVMHMVVGVIMVMVMVMSVVVGVLGAQPFWTG